MKRIYFLESPIPAPAAAPYPCGSSILLSGRSIFYEMCLYSLKHSFVPLIIKKTKLFCPKPGSSLTFFGRNRLKRPKKATQRKGRSLYQISSIKLLGGIVQWRVQTLWMQGFSSQDCFDYRQYSPSGQIMQCTPGSETFQYH